MGIESPVHLLFIAAVALIVLGPKRLPQLARALGQSIREFRGAIESAQSEPEELPAQEELPEHGQLPAPGQLPASAAAPVAESPSGAAEGSLSTTAAEAGGAPAEPSPSVAGEPPRPGEAPRG